MQQKAKPGKLKLKKKAVFALVLVAAVLLTATVVIIASSATSVKKNISLVINDTENVIATNYNISTSKKYLSDALLEKKLITGEKREDGFVIISADGKRAEEYKYQCWVVHINQERVDKDPSKIKIKDGDVIELRLEYWK